MIPEFDEGELNRPDRQRETELTLGTGMLLALGCGLLLLCIVCFGLGYAVGHRSEPVAGAVSPQAGVPSPIQTSGSGTKPTARAQAPPTPPPATVAVKVPDDPGKGTAQATGNAPSAIAARAAEPPQSAQTPGASSAQVRPALATQGGAVQGAQSTSTLHVQPALSQVQGWMVQIAAVAQTEDAEVLVNALKKRGYAVTVRRDVADTLLHVQTGPFVNRNDASAMRQKLLNDGYNAIVQP